MVLFVNHFKMFENFILIKFNMAAPKWRLSSASARETSSGNFRSAAYYSELKSVIIYGH